ncbi:VWA domain-containing protein [Longispora sp. NPDC051575]|uniref:vWA domain-containing protein n=1 Tax=Longispora sp. NPDC051575 TaxID=3154943 RepID=UPI0034302377
MTEFQVEVDQNEYLSDGASTVDAIATVTSTGQASTGVAPRAAEIIVIDRSGSMEYPPTKIKAAKEATRAAIDALRDGTLFAVIAGSSSAQIVYPRVRGLVPANATTRDEAKKAVQGVKPGGGTAIGSWLTLARELFLPHTDAIRHVILLTDGKNESEPAVDLQHALDACAGVFVCDARGIGTNWVVDELRRITTALLGSFDIVADPAHLKDDFRALMTHAMGKAHGDIRLRLWTPRGATVKFVKLVAPEVRDLTGGRIDVSAQIGDYPTGSWGSERRDYHVCVEIAPGAVGEEILAGRIRLVEVAADGTEQILGQGLVRAVWTDDLVLSTRLHPSVAHYTGQAELADAIQEGLEARRAGDTDTATSKLGKAVKLAAETGNEATSKLLKKVVDVLDADTGTVKLKPKVSAEDEMTLDVGSTRTVRTNKKN